MTTHSPPAAADQSDITAAVAAMGPGALTEDALIRHVHPLFSRVLGREEIYLSNHSLGRPLDRTMKDVRLALDLWYDDMDEAWSSWLKEINSFRAGIARLIGLSRADAVVPKPGAGQGLRAVLNALPKPVAHVVATRGEFDSIDYILKTYQARGRARITWVEPDSRGLFSVEAIERAIDGAPGGPVDLVVVSHVVFNSGQVITGLDSLVSTAHARGALVVVDAYHSAGVMPVDFERLGADFAIGGSYKYTRGGPGAGWLAIHPRHLDSDRLVTLDTGWFAKKDVFAFRRSDHPDRAPGGDGWLECTPIALTAYQARSGLELTLALGVDRLRAFALDQQAFFAARLEAHAVPVWDVHPRGAFLLIPDDDAFALSHALKDAGINTDARPGPGGGTFVRACPDILNTRAELEKAATIIGRVIAGSPR